MNCSSCAMDLPAEARFCFRCGTPAAPPAPPPEERRIVSLVFCDLAGSTELSGMLDPELLRSVLLRYYALMTGVVEASGGIVEKFIGDAVMAVFGLTSTREDDARRALTAALGMTEAAARFSDELDRDHGVRLRVRVGVHTGEVVATSDPSSRQAFVSGEVVNVAARLEGAAPIGQVLVSAAARNAAGGALVVADRQWLALKGVGERVEAFRLLEVPPPDPELMRRFDVPFVGRERELDALDAAWHDTVRQRRPRLLTVLGEPGIGKTRLVREWLDGRASVKNAVSGRCRAHGEGGSLTALAECVAPLVEGAEPASAVALLRAGLLRDGTPSPSVNDTAAAVAAVLGGLAERRPLLLVLDDVHHAEPTLHTVLDRLVAEVDGPVLFLRIGRPDGAVERSDDDTVLVGTLPRADAELVAAGLVDVVAHDDAVLTRIVDQAGGNPLYLEQLAAAVHDDGLPVGHLPLTLRSLVAARIDRLGEDERTALRHSALVGDGVGDFEPADVRELSDSADPVPMLPRLARLRLVEQAAQRYRFVSGVTQQVAYEGLTKKRRGELHERYADRLVQRSAPDPLVGNHLASAYVNLTAVGLPEDRRTVLRRRACEHLLRGGALALRRTDLPWALTLLGRCADLVREGDPARPECLGLLGEVRLMLGRRAEAIETLHDAVRAADASERATVAAHARLYLAMTSHDAAVLAEVVAQVLPVFAVHDDHLGLARGGLIQAGGHQRVGGHARALGLLDAALDHALTAGADRELANTLGAIGLSLWHGPEPAGSAVLRCGSLMAEHGRRRPAVRATMGFAFTMLHAIRGDAPRAAAARSDYDRAMSSMSYADSRLFRPLLTGLVAEAAGDPTTARQGLGEALDVARELGGGGLLLLAGLELARVLLDDGDRDGAAALLAELDVGDDTPPERAAYLGLTARLTADLAPAHEAVAVAGRTDSPADHGRALLDLAHTATALGDRATARVAGADALARFTAKGHLVGAQRARRFVT